MPSRTKEERERRRLEALERKKERDESKRRGVGKGVKKRSETSTSTTKTTKNDLPSLSASSLSSSSSAAVLSSSTSCSSSPLVSLPGDSLENVLSFLPSRELGAATMTCMAMNRALVEARVSHLLSRLNPHRERSLSPSSTATAKGDLRDHMRMCRDQADVWELLDRSLVSADAGSNCNTGRLITERNARGEGADEYVSYVRFVEEGVCGYATQSFGGKTTSLLPPVVNGRYASCSPEHTLCRIGGSGTCRGAGGSGVSSWGVGKRGQLGHGKREDEDLPKPLTGGIGYRMRIVQVSAGGGLVRVAHSLLLTESGRVLSFGTAMYGQLGHGYSAGRQLSDELRPRYIDALSGVRCTCVSAGELHSAVVTTDGDVYAWGDGFCGQLGLGDKRPQLLPVQVTDGGLEDECVSTVSCGNRHTICVTEDGEIFTFGLGHFGALGRAYTPFECNAEAAIGSMVGAGEEEQLNAMLPGVAAAVGADRTDSPPPPAHRAADGTVRENEGRFDANDIRAHLDLIANLTLDDSSDQCIPKVVDSLEGITIVGASAGHRHSLFLDSVGNVYSCGAGLCGELGHGDFLRQKFPMLVKEFANSDVRILQMSAGVDMSMAVTTTGDVYAWGKSDGGRLGLGLEKNKVSIPRKVVVRGHDGRASIRAIDVECGYVHSLIVGLDGTVHVCGGVGTDGRDDGQQREGEGVGEDDSTAGRAIPLKDFNIWHRIPEPKEKKSNERWKKYGKYEVKGRSTMMDEVNRWS